MQKIVITGGSGFIGSNLVSYLSQRNYEIAILSRDPGKSKLSNVKYYHWDIKDKKIDLDALKNVDHIINLAGANIGSERWSDERKKVIMDSRVESTNFLFKSVADHSPKVKSIVSASAVGYYGTFNSDKILDGNSPQGNDFLAEVCGQWEQAALQFEEIGTRTVILRQGVVIGKGGGISERMAGIAKFGLNTAVGSGEQFLPWVDMKDLVRLYRFMLEHESSTGAFNAVSGTHTNMNEFAKALSSAMHKPILTPNAPAFIIKLLYGELSMTLLKGSRVSNEKLLKEGFSFNHTEIHKVLRRIFS